MHDPPLHKNESIVIVSGCKGFVFLKGTTNIFNWGPDWGPPDVRELNITTYTRIIYVVLFTKR
jgi:hypothetical protein